MIEISKIKTFATELEARIRQHCVEHYPNLDPDCREVTFTVGKKYARIVYQERYDFKVTHKSVHCFIDLANGNILKAAGWAKPAKHARGNIDKPWWLTAVGPHGACYLR